MGAVLQVSTYEMMGEVFLQVPPLLRRGSSVVLLVAVIGADGRAVGG